MPSQNLTFSGKNYGEKTYCETTLALVLEKTENLEELYIREGISVMQKDKETC